MKKTIYILFLLSIFVVFSSFAKLTEITSKQQLEDLKNNNKYLLLKFHAIWCPPCKTTAPLFKNLANQESLNHILFVNIDTDEHPEISKSHGIIGIPAFIFVKDKKVIHKEEGGVPNFEMHMTEKLNEVFPKEVIKTKPASTPKKKS